MKLEVGMYVRYKRGSMGYIEPADKIGKIINIIFESDIFELDNNNNSIFESDVVKASYNIIDILEVGDYINSEKIDYISISKDGKKRPLIRDNIYLFDKYKSINSIVTKEQFEQMSYKVGE